MIDLLCWKRMWGDGICHGLGLHFLFCPFLAASSSSRLLVLESMWPLPHQSHTNASTKVMTESSFHIMPLSPPIPATLFTRTIRLLNSSQEWCLLPHPQNQTRFLGPTPRIWPQSQSRAALQRSLFFTLRVIKQNLVGNIRMADCGKSGTG